MEWELIGWQANVEVQCTECFHKEYIRMDELCTGYDKTFGVDYPRECPGCNKENNG